MGKKNYYEILGVSEHASDDQIKKQYRRLARQYHPDVSREHNAEYKFKQIQEAYDHLKNASKRAAYDEKRKGTSSKPFNQGSRPSPWEQDHSDFFSQFFNQKKPSSHQSGEDFHTQIDVDLADTLNGHQKSYVIHVPEVNHHGDRQFVAKSFTVSIPKHIRPGQKIRLKRQGATRSFQGAKGDLYLEVNLLAQPFYLKDQDLYLDLPVAPWEAALGCAIQVPTVAGTVQLKIAPGTQAGTKLRLKGRGLPANGRHSQATDVYIVVQIVIPLPKNSKDELFYQKMEKSMAFNPRKHWPNGDSF